MKDIKEYYEFLERKKHHIEDSGFSVEDSQLNPILFPFQKYCVKKALIKGKYALFKDCGLGKDKQYHYGAWRYIEKIIQYRSNGVREQKIAYHRHHIENRHDEWGYLYRPRYTFQYLYGSKYFMLVSFHLWSNELLILPLVCKWVFLGVSPSPAPPLPSASSRRPSALASRSLPPLSVSPYKVMNYFVNYQL